MRHLLFICSRIRWRSPTAENVFAEYPGVECLSAGLSHDAVTPVTPEALVWADLIFVMERKHKSKLSAVFQPFLANTPVVCLGIPDNFKFMDPTLVQLLKRKVERHLPTVALSEHTYLRLGNSTQSRACKHKGP